MVDRRKARRRGAFGVVAGAIVGLVAGNFAAAPIAFAKGAAPRSEQPAQQPASSATPAAFTSLDGAITFRVPAEGSPDYSDYQEMLRQPRFRSALEGTQGYAIPYDPEWRSELTGRRQAPPVPDRFESGRRSLEDLGRAVVLALNANEPAALDGLRVTSREFQRILWPEFPQSRPYLKIPPEEAWRFHVEESFEGIRAALDSHGGHGLRYRGVEYTKKTPYRNFVRYEGVIVRALDPATGREVRLAFMPDVVEQRGRVRVMTYKG